MTRHTLVEYLKGRCHLTLIFIANRVFVGNMRDINIPLLGSQCIHEVLHKLMFIIQHM